MKGNFTKAFMILLFSLVCTAVMADGTVPLADGGSETSQTLSNGLVQVTLTNPDGSTVVTTPQSDGSSVIVSTDANGNVIYNGTVPKPAAN